MRDALYATLNGTKENRKNTRKAAEKIGSCGPQLTPDVGARQCISGAAVMIAVIPTITLKAKQILSKSYSSRSYKGKHKMTRDTSALPTIRFVFPYEIMATRRNLHEREPLAPP